MEIQWFRSELKSKAKQCLKQYYWKAFLVTLIVALLGGGGGISGSFSAGRSTSNVETEMNEEVGEDFSGTLPGMELDEDHAAFLTVLVMVLLVVFVITFVITVIFITFVGNPVAVGGKRFFMESRAFMKSAGVGRVFWAFGEGRYLNVVKTMFLRALFVNLWSLLLIIPGIIKAYQYYMVPYILSENPDMNYKEVLQLSKEMMAGHKWNTFVLELSFLGWQLLGVMLCGIGVLFVHPYVEATFAELYAVLRQKAVGSSLRGFGEPEVYDKAISDF